MVRKRKTQPVRAPSGRAYGERQDIEDAQRQVPLPAQPPPPAPDEAPMRGPFHNEEALAQFPFPAPMLPGPSTRPNEPITAGLAQGPGPGPEVIGFETPSISQAYRDLAAATDDPDLAYLATLVGRLNL